MTRISLFLTVLLVGLAACNPQDDMIQTECARLTERAQDVAALATMANNVALIAINAGYAGDLLAFYVDSRDYWEDESFQVRMAQRLVCTAAERDA